MTTVKLSDIVGYYADPEAILTSYSGRGMYGKTCLGLVVDQLRVVDRLSEFVLFVTEIVRDVEATEWAGTDSALSDFADDIHNVSVDNMGLSTIYYWPSVQVEED